MAREANRRGLRSAVVGLGLAVSLAAAGPAFADITVTPSTEPAGGSGLLTFRVTDDIPDAGTTSFELDLPAEHPLVGVVPTAKFGWDLAIERSGIPGPTAGRVTRVIWSAHSTTTAIQPGRHGTFSISVREFPLAATRISIPALQTWSNGAVVRWTDATVPGGPTPLHAAPQITLTAAGSTNAPASASTGPTGLATASGSPSASGRPSASGSPSASATPENAAPVPIAMPEESGPSAHLVDMALGLASGAIVLALIAIGMSGTALSRRRSDGEHPIST